MYVAWYGAGRFVIEGLRTDSLMLGDLRVSQVLAALLSASAIVLLIVTAIQYKRLGKEAFVLYVDTEESKKLLAEAQKAREKSDTTISEIDDDSYEKIISDDDTDSSENTDSKEETADKNTENTENSDNSESESGKETDVKNEASLSDETENAENSDKSDAESEEKADSTEK